MLPRAPSSHRHHPSLSLVRSAFHSPTKPRPATSPKGKSPDGGSGTASTTPARPRGSSSPAQLDHRHLSRPASAVPSPAQSSASSPPSASLSRLSLHLDAPAGPPSPAPSPASSSRLEQPLEWATQSVAVPTPRNAGAVLFFRLFRMPPASGGSGSSSPGSAAPLGDGASSDSDSSSSSSSYDSHPAARARAPQQARERAKAAEQRRMFLCVATSRNLLFLFEATPDDSEGRRRTRSWVLTREFFVRLSACVSHSHERILLLLLPDLLGRVD